MLCRYRTQEPCRGQARDVCRLHLLEARRRALPLVAPYKLVYRGNSDNWKVSEMSQLLAWRHPRSNVIMSFDRFEVVRSLEAVEDLSLSVLGLFRTLNQLPRPIAIFITQLRMWLAYAGGKSLSVRDLRRTPRCWYTGIPTR